MVLSKVETSVSVNRDLCVNALVSDSVVYLPFQSAAPVTIAAVSGQARIVLDASGGQSGGRVWHAKTWRSKRTREVGASDGKRGKADLRKHNTTMIVVVHLLPLCSSPP